MNNPLASSLTILSPLHPSNSNTSNSNGVLYNWGEKFTSKPSYNNILPVNIRNISNGYSHSLALGEDNQVYSWGDNRSLQLGVPGLSANFSDKPLLVGKSQFSNLKVKAIACGGCFSAVILENGLLYTWGVLAEGSKYTEIPTKVDLLKGVTSVSVGINHVAVVAETTTPGEKRAVFTWGSNKKGQLGVPGDSITTAPRRVTLGSKAISVACGEEFTVAIVEGNEVFIWGNNKSKQICSNNSDEILSIPVKPFIGRDIVEISASRTFVAGRSSHGEVCIWGNNEFVVRAGDSDKFLSLPARIKQIAVGLNHIVALSEGGSIFTWGSGDDGQLGHDDKKSLNQSKLVESLKGRNVLSVHAWGRCSGAIVEPGNFRVEISETMKRVENRNSPAPLFIRRLVNYLRGDNSKAEGVFRLNGSVARLDELERKLDSAERFSMSKFEPYDAADIIKRYLKTLPEPLFTNAGCAKYEKELLKLSDQSAREQMIFEWISKIPAENRTILIYILSFLNEIAYAQLKHQKNNAMAEKNLALVFAPNLLTRGEIGNDDIIEDMIKLLPEIMKKYPEMESSIIIDQANECLSSSSSRTGYIIDHWIRIMKERPETAKPAFYQQPVLTAIINSLVDGIVHMKSSRSNSFSGNNSPSHQILSNTSSPNHSPENSPAQRISTQSMSLNSLLNVGTSSPNIGGSYIASSTAGASNSNLMTTFSALSLSGPNNGFMITKQSSTPVLGSSSSGHSLLSSSGSQINLMEQNRQYEAVLSLVLSPVINVKNIIKVLPSIFEIDNVNALFIKLLLMMQFEHTVSDKLQENITAQSQSIKDLQGALKDKLPGVLSAMESIVSDVYYLNSCHSYWKTSQASINSYSTQILSYFKWWGEFLDKTNKELEEKVLRLKKDYDKLESEKLKLEKQQNKLNDSKQAHSNSSPPDIKLEFDIWCINNQVDVLTKKLEHTNQQILKFQQEKLNALTIYEQFKPHLQLLEDFINNSVIQSINSYLEKLHSYQSNIPSLFPQIFSQFVDTLFLNLKEISSDSSLKDSLCTSLSNINQIFQNQKIPQKYILSLELETKFNSLKKNVFS